jgi:TPR repeat protein
MTSLSKFTVITALLAVLVACNETMNERKSMSPTSTATTFFLSDNEQSELTRLAIGGDVNAAFRLYMYFTFSRGDPDGAKPWLKLAAEGKHAIAQSHYAVYFLSKKDFESAKLWAKKSLDNGNKEAESLLQSIVNEEKELNKK